VEMTKEHSEKIYPQEFLPLKDI